MRLIMMRMRLMGNDLLLRGLRHWRRRDSRSALFKFLARSKHFGNVNFYKRKFLIPCQLSHQPPPLSNRIMKKKCDNITESRRNSRIRNSESFKQQENNMIMYELNTANSSTSSITSNSNARRKNLILKHEILSPECDLFKASTPRRRHFISIAKIIGTVLLTILGSFYVLKNNLGKEKIWITWIVGFLGFISFTTITLMLLQTIEGKKILKNIHMLII